MPFSGPSAAAAASSAFTSSGLVARLTSNTQSVMDELVSGTRTARPFSLPLSSGKMSAIAVALPVLVGARLTSPLRARRRSLFLALGASSSVCVLVMLWIVVMQPRTMPSFSWITCAANALPPAARQLAPGAARTRWQRTLTTGARQFVVQDAAVTMWSTAGSYSAWLTPYTTFSTGCGSFTGAETTTLRTPQASK